MEASDRTTAGNPPDRRAVAAVLLADLGIFEQLGAHTPLLAGTVPLGLDLPGSDLDIICQAGDLEAFATLVRRLYGDRPGFRVAIKPVVGVPSVVASFEHGGFPIELFAQQQPVEQQRAYRHLVVEQRLLALGGSAAAAGILALRRRGMKTEPAFAAYFGLAGDPYQALLDLYELDGTALAAAVVDR